MWQGSTTQKAGWLGRALNHLDGKVAWSCYFDADRSDVSGDHDWEISDIPPAARAWRVGVS